VPFFLTATETKSNLMSSAGLEAGEDDLDELGLEEEGLDPSGAEQAIEDD
jgi:hypothetical protein